MDMHQFSIHLEQALKTTRAITFSCRCRIRYSGRAESALPWGDRIVIIKQDKTLLVHQPVGSNPVNYMKEDTHHSRLEKDGHIILESRNLPQREYMDIEISDVHSFSDVLLEDGQKIIVSGSEKDMADMICAQPDIIELGFKPLSMEEHTKYGYIDVFGYDKDNKLVIVECKRHRADLEAVSQLRRYVEKVKKSKGLSNVRGILAAPRISANAQKMLTDFGFTFRQIQPPKYRERFDKDQQSLNGYVG